MLDGGGVRTSSISRNRAFRTAAGAATIPLTPLTIQAGDRLVVEVGARDNSDETEASATVVFGDNHADDLLEGYSSSSTALNPWIEFSHDFFNSPAVAVAAAGCRVGGATRMSARWPSPARRATVAPPSR